MKILGNILFALFVGIISSEAADGSFLLLVSNISILWGALLIRDFMREE